MFSFFGASASDANPPHELTRFQQIKEFKNIESILSQLVIKKDELANQGAKIMASFAYKNEMAAERFSIRKNAEPNELEKMDMRPIEIKKAEVLIELLKSIDSRIEEFNESDKKKNIILERKSKYFLMRDLVVMIDEVLDSHCALLNEFRKEDNWVDMNGVTHYGSRLATMAFGLFIASPAGIVAGAAGLMGGAIGGKYVERFIKNNIDIGKAPKSLQLLVQLHEAITKEGIVLELNLAGELNAHDFNSSNPADQDEGGNDDLNKRIDDARKKLN